MSELWTDERIINELTRDVAAFKSIVVVRNDLQERIAELEARVETQRQELIEKQQYILELEAVRRWEPVEIFESLTEGESIGLFRYVAGEGGNGN